MENITTATIVSKSNVARQRQYRWPLILTVLWLGATAAGLCLLAQYADKPGVGANPLEKWPADTEIELSPNGVTLVMFAHPHCPCTRASLSELDRMLSHCKETITPWIVFYKPIDQPSDWEHSDLWRSACTIPHAHVISDFNGAEAIRFHAFTSGQTLVYDVHGTLQFSGGITGARGHEGDNAGETAVEELANHGESQCRRTAVFGCPIVNPTAQ